MANADLETWCGTVADAVNGVLNEAPEEYRQTLATGTGLLLLRSAMTKAPAASREAILGMILTVIINHARVLNIAVPAPDTRLTPGAVH